MEGVRKEEGGKWEGKISKNGRRHTRRQKGMGQRLCGHFRGDMADRGRGWRPAQIYCTLSSPTSQGSESNPDYFIDNRHL